MSGLTGYQIAPDAYGDLTIWNTRGEAVLVRTANSGGFFDDVAAAIEEARDA